MLAALDYQLQPCIAGNPMLVRMILCPAKYSTKLPHHSNHNFMRYNIPSLHGTTHPRHDTTSLHFRHVETFPNLLWVAILWPQHLTIATVMSVSMWIWWMSCWCYKNRGQAYMGWGVCVQCTVNTVYSECSELFAWSRCLYASSMRQQAKYRRLICQIWI